jgi:hypothetical protein
VSPKLSTSLLFTVTGAWSEPSAWIALAFGGAARRLSNVRGAIERPSKAIAAGVQL